MDLKKSSRFGQKGQTSSLMKMKNDYDDDICRIEFYVYLFVTFQKLPMNLESHEKWYIFVLSESK